MDVLNHLGLAQTKVIVATGMTTEIRLSKLVLLNHSSHTSIEQEDAFGAADGFGQRRSLDGKRFAFDDFALASFRSLLFGHIAQADTFVHLLFDLGRLILLDDTECLLHFGLVVEIHFEMHTIATDIVEQRTKFIDRNPTSHNGLATRKNLLVEVIPLRIATLRLADARCPLDGLKFLNLKECRQMTHRANAIEMIERVGNPLCLLANERMHETPVILDRKHRRDVALQLGELVRRPQREIAECHLAIGSEIGAPIIGIEGTAAIATVETDDVVERIEHLEIGIVDALHLLLQQIGLRQGIHQHLVGAFHRRQHVKAFHQVGHTDVVITL